MTFAPRFSPDGQRIIMSLQSGGDSNIYEMDLRTRQNRQLTNGGGLDTGPCYSPDGRQVVFESDREGTQQLYVMNSDGSGVRRLSIGRGALFDAGLVAARRLHRVHEATGRAVPDWRDAPRRLGRAGFDRGLP